jgi:hypothetical protein
LIGDPVAFWKHQHAQAKRDAATARKLAPSVVPNHIRLEREAWKEYQSALAAREVNGSGAPAAAPGAAPPSPPLAADSLEQELADVQRLRRSAEAAGSYVAAAKLLAAEREVGDRIRARDEAASKAARRAMSADELVAALASRISSMPLAMQERVRVRLGWV